MNVRLTPEQKIKILNADDVYKIMQQILLRENKISRNQEHFWVVGLDTKNKILFIELIGLGTVNRVNANPPDVFRMGIYKLAVSMILVHNHPSGDLTPSQADLDMTDRMLKVGQLINIEVLDHLIISEKGFTSLENTNAMQQLRTSGLFEIVEREKLEIQKWKLDIEKNKARKEERLNLAKKLKAEGMDEKFIKKVTGLLVGDIRGI
ncbi:JAB domain-containing protein [bacterium SCSIO 12643]|nr:JAB domain-containing protein [bacterium SCSIO 12643]